MYTNVPGVKLLTNGKIIVTPNHVYAGQNKLDLTKDTVYRHPSSKQCNYYVDLSNYVTKSGLSDELKNTQTETVIKNVVKGMIDVSGRLIGSDYWLTPPTITTPSDADYCIIKTLKYIEKIITGTSISATSTYFEITVCRNGNGMIPEVYNDNSYSAIVNWTGNTLSYNGHFANRMEQLHIEWYKYPD